MEFFISLQVYCDMVSEDEAWTLLARFSNSDTKYWMDDSGDWWYDSAQVAGETTDPSHNPDMISPVFWLVSGRELKITRKVTLDTLLYCKPQGTVWVGRHSAPRLLAMATSETVQSGLRVSALENAKLNMEDNTWQLRASDRLHAVVTCKVLMRSASGVTRAGVLLWSWLEVVELVVQVPTTELGQRWRNFPLLKSKKITEENLT